jgi:hypothetical protein
MTTQNYLIIESNVVSNIVLWDGDVNIWTPPADSIQLIQETTPAMVWMPVFTDGKITDYVLTEVLGAGQIGFTWNGTTVNTTDPKPTIPTQPVTTGTQTI